MNANRIQQNSCATETGMNNFLSETSVINKIMYKNYVWEI